MSQIFSSFHTTPLHTFPQTDLTLSINFILNFVLDLFKLLYLLQSNLFSIHESFLDSPNDATSACNFYTHVSSVVLQCEEGISDSLPVQIQRNIDSLLMVYQLMILKFSFILVRINLNYSLLEKILKKIRSRTINRGFFECIYCYQ